MKENGRCGCYLREKVTFGQEVRKLALRLSGVKNAKTQRQVGVPWRKSKCASVATALLRGKGCGRKGFQRDGWGWSCSLYFYTEGNGKPLKGLEQRSDMM